MTLGDLGAQVAACAVAERALQELAARHGRERLAALMTGLIDHTERLVRQRDRVAGPTARRRSPTTSTRTGSTSATCRSSRTVTIAGDEVTADLTESAPMVRGVAQLDALVRRRPASTRRSAARSTLEIPNTAGAFRPITRADEAGHGVRGRDAGRVVDARRHRLPGARRDQRRARAADPGSRAGGGRGRQHARDLRRRAARGRAGSSSTSSSSARGAARPSRDGNDGAHEPGEPRGEHPGRGRRVGVPDRRRALRARPRLGRRRPAPRRARGRARLALPDAATRR